MENDPGEMKNFAENENHKDILEKHRGLIRGWVEKRHTTGLLLNILFANRRDLPLS